MDESSLPAIPIADLHCDLLYYLVRAKGANVHKVEDIGVSLPHLEAGNVELQTMAIFSPTESGSSRWGQKQVNRFVELGLEAAFHPIRKVRELQQAMEDRKIGIVAAVENASGFCEEDEPLEFGFERLENWIARTGRIFYVSFTHHAENRFGGGNYSDNVGLKADGEALLDWMDGRQICVDLSHSSDRLAHDIFSYVSRYSLDVPIIASHSNFRPLCGHVRNLPDELAQEIIRQGGLIGMNFLRAYVDNEDPEKLYEHIHYGLENLKAENNLVFGADFFYTKNFPDPSRHPLFFTDLSNASQYPSVLKKLHKQGMAADQLKKLGHQNVVDFIARIWGN